MKKDNKTRLFEVMSRLDKTFKPILNENAFNSAGEPNMTHQQYNDYSEPSEPEYDDQDNYEREQTSNDIVKEIEKHFDTILETYDGIEYNFLTKKLNGDLMLYAENNMVSAYAPNNNKFPETNAEDLDVNDLFKFFEPYRQNILSGDEAKREMTNIQKQNSADSRYASQERSAMGG